MDREYVVKRLLDGKEHSEIRIVIRVLSSKTAIRYLITDFKFTNFYPCLYHPIFLLNGSSLCNLGLSKYPNLIYTFNPSWYSPRRSESVL